MRELQPFYDGDTGPIYPFRLKDSTGLVDLSAIAVEMYVYDESGTFIARRAGLPVSPKANGVLNLMLLGRECDWDGVGRNLIVKPKIYGAISPTGTWATNLLVNPSFDAATGTNPARLPDNWTLVGARTAVWDNYSNDPWPPAISGTFQLVNHASLADPDYIQQQPAVSMNPGDRLSVGCWHRILGIPGHAAGGVKNNNHGLFFRHGAQANTVAQFEIATRDWYFVTGSVVTPTVESGVTLGIDGRGTTSSNRYDEAFAFKGFWRTLPTDPYRVAVRPTRRVTKTGGNAIARVGSFEQDSDGDGIPDGWRLPSAGTNTYSLEADPANVAHEDRSLKVVLAGATGKTLEYVARGRYRAGETWRAKVKVKTLGALTGSPTNGQWAIQVHGDYFDGEPETLQSGTITNFGTNLAVFTEYTSDITIATGGLDLSALVIFLNFNGVTGTAWLDDVILTRV